MIPIFPLIYGFLAGVGMTLLAIYFNGGCA